jgi:hypothetical protein
MELFLFAMISVGVAGASYAVLRRWVITGFGRGKNEAKGGMTGIENSHFGGGGGL